MEFFIDFPGLLVLLILLIGGLIEWFARIFFNISIVAGFTGPDWRIKENSLQNSRIVTHSNTEDSIIDKKIEIDELKEDINYLQNRLTNLKSRVEPLRQQYNLREADETESEIFNINKKIGHNKKVILELEKEIKDLEKLE